MKEAAYIVKDLSFHWQKGKPILHNINLSIKPGIMTVIAGQNGSGKSTLIKLLAGLLTPIHGEILFYNKPLSYYNKKTLAKHMAYVEQNTEEHIHLTVRNIVSLGTFPHRKLLETCSDETDSKIEEALNTTGTNHLSERYFNTLSGGEKQKVMIARGVCQSSSVLLLDEPTSALDVKNRIEIMELLRKLIALRGITIILISHDFNLISRYADEVIFLKECHSIQGQKKSILTQENMLSTFETSIKSTVIEGETIFYY